MCIFCKIVAKKGSAYDCQVFYEDKYFIGMLVRNPLTRGHSIVFPKKHINDITLVDSNQIFALMNCTIINAKKITKILGATSFTLKLNNRVYKIEKGSGHVSHTHIHIIPRYKANEIRDNLPPKISDSKLMEIKKLLA